MYCISVTTSEFKYIKQTKVLLRLLSIEAAVTTLTRHDMCSLYFIGYVPKFQHVNMLHAMVTTCDVNLSQKCPQTMICLFFSSIHLHFN